MKKLTRVLALLAIITTAGLSPGCEAQLIACLQAQKLLGKHSEVSIPECPGLIFQQHKPLPRWQKIYDN